MKNTWKMETSKDMTSWEYVAHAKSRKAIEKKIRRKNRRKVKKALDNLLKCAIL